MVKKKETWGEHYVLRPIQKARIMAKKAGVPQAEIDENERKALLVWLKSL